jgi:hypothetical protein
MFRKQLLSWEFWKRFVLYLFIYLLGFFIIHFVGIGEPIEPTASFLTKYVGIGFCMAIIAAFSNKGQEKEDILYEKPTWNEFFGTYLLLLIFGFMIMSLLLLIGWLIFYFFSKEPAIFFPTYLKSLAAVAILCLLINGFFFIRQLLNYRKHKVVDRDL